MAKASKPLEVPAHDWNGVILPGHWAGTEKAREALRMRASDARREGARCMAEAAELDGLISVSGLFERRELTRRKMKLLTKGARLLRLAEQLLQLKLPFPEKKWSFQ